MKTIVTTIIILTMLFISGVSFFRYYAPSKTNVIYSQNLNKKDLDSVISDYIKNDYFNWDNVSAAKKYEAHKVYGIDNLFGLKYVYLDTMFEAKNDSGTNSGGANPLVIIIKENANGEYSVVNHKEPRNGDEYGLSLKVLIPQKYLKNIDSIESRAELQKQIILEKRNS